jgi:hypothetical protein
MLKFKNPADQSSNMAATGPSFELKPYAYCRDRQPFGEAFVGLALDINLYFRPTKSTRDIILAQKTADPGSAEVDLDSKDQRHHQKHFDSLVGHLPVLPI